MTLNDRIEILASFGDDLADICNGKEVEGFPGFEKIKVYNPWFTEENVRFCLQNWHSQLERKSLTDFCLKAVKVTVLYREVLKKSDTLPSLLCSDVMDPAQIRTTGKWQ